LGRLTTLVFPLYNVFPAAILRVRIIEECALTNNVFIGRDDFQKLIGSLLSNYPVFAPLKVYDVFAFKKITADNLQNIEVGQYRTVNSIRQFFYPIAENVLELPKPGGGAGDFSFVVLGAKACDLSALEVIDQVYGAGEIKDPFYLSRRQNALIISADCTDAAPTCFCRLVKGQPYPEKGFDLNLSPVTDGFVVEAGSAKGEKLLKEHASLFIDATQALEEQFANRTIIVQKVDALNQEFANTADLTDLHRHTLENEGVWRKITRTCVDCQACNRACPSCTCFLLIDQINKGAAEKIKVWDNCLHGAYTRVAGGANDRATLFSRLQNRYQCKFDYMVSRIGRYSCVGCGRCIDACCGKIDMRQVFKELAKAAVLSARLE